MFDWKELAMVLSFIIFIGSWADLLIINDEWEKIKARLFSKSLKIKSSNINEIVFIFAQKVLIFLDGAASSSSSSSSSSSDKNYSTSKIFLIIWVFGVFVLYMIWSNFVYFTSMVLVLPLLGISFFWFVLILIYEMATDKWTQKGDNYWITFTKTSLISASITYIAVLFGSELHSLFGISEFWFQKTDHMATGIIRYNELIGLINYPFDFLSLAFTYSCVKRIAKRKAYYPLLPVLDVAFSLILSCILYCVFYSLSEGTLSYSLLTNDVKDLLVNGPDKSQFDLIYLLPIILSTFLPISLLGIFILGLIFYKFSSLIFARVLHVLSEKKGSIFKDIAVSISAFLALVNAIIVYNVSP